MNLINEQYTGNQLCDTLIDIFVDNLIDFTSQFISNFGFLGRIELIHQGDKVLATLGFGIGNIQIVQSDVLNDFFLLVDIAFGQGNIFLSFKIKLGGISVRSTDSFDSTTGGFDVDNITNIDLFFLKSLINTGIQLQLFGSLGSLQTNDHTGDSLGVSAMRIILFFGRNFSHLSFPNFLSFLNSQTNCPTEVFHQNFSFLNFGRVYLRTDQRTKGNLGAQFLGNSQSNSGFTSSGGTSQEQSSSSHFLTLNHINNNSGSLSSFFLTNETGGNFLSGTIFV
mmetsp:Transcript_35097/g.39833  ORF Transcript_35097/g.39833 Transcript_35097/m.39833 type:complete len:280 (-) Transcript_35097:131-970(-)